MLKTTEFKVKENCQGRLYELVSKLSMTNSDVISISHKNGLFKLESDDTIFSYPLLEKEDETIYFLDFFFEELGYIIEEDMVITEESPDGEGYDTVVKATQEPNSTMEERKALLIKAIA